MIPSAVVLIVMILLAVEPGKIVDECANTLFYMMYMYQILSNIAPNENEVLNITTVTMSFPFLFYCIINASPVSQRKVEELLRCEFQRTKTFSHPRNVVAISRRCAGNTHS